MAAAAAPRRRTAALFALPVVGLMGWFAWRVHASHPKALQPLDVLGEFGDPLPLWLELLLFAAGLVLALLVRRRGAAPAVAQKGSAAHTQRASFLPKPLHDPAQERHDGQELPPLPQGAQSLLAILARALGEAEVALFVRQGSRLVCRAQEPKAFGAQSAAGTLMQLLGHVGAAVPMRAWHLPSEHNVRHVRRVAVPLHVDHELSRNVTAGLGPWAVLLAQRRHGPLGEADQALVRSVAEQIAVSLQLEQALRYAQADRLRLEHMATTDSLTELANRRHFMRIFTLQLARAKRYTRRLSLIFLDIDHFKQVNDTFGHATGDEVLKGVAQVLRQTARKTDTVARYGGEEFAILMEETGLTGAQRSAERIQEALKKTPFGPKDAPFYKTVSVGVATFPEHGEEPERLIACADEALYQAKRNGRDQITLYRGPDDACSSEPR